MATNIGTHSSQETNKKSGAGNPQKASPANVERYLKGIHYPAQKKDLIECAQNNNAPEDIMNVINRFEEREYKATTDVAKEIGKVNKM